MGCVDDEPLVRGCFFASSRECIVDTKDGTIAATTGTQVWFDDGEVMATIAARFYNGTTLIDSCTVTQAGTIRRR